MPKSTNQKQKILHIMRLFLDHTDEENAITLADIITTLSHAGITSERKSIYDDIETLRQFGIDIVTRKTKTTEYFVANRTFQLPELKLLVDIVQSSKFITHKKSYELIKKLESLTSSHQAKSLQRHVFVTNRVKTMNEKIYINVDTIHSAISDNRQISFKYFDYDLEKNKQYRSEGKTYTVNPYALSWNDENYYLIANYPKYTGLNHLRVDRMSDLKLLDEKRRPLKEVTTEKDFDLAEYSKKIFSMFTGNEETVKIKMDKSLVNVAIDKFGKDVFLEKADEDSFYIRVKVSVSSTFLAWVFQFGGKVKIISPESVVEKYRDMLKSCLFPGGVPSENTLL